MGDEEERVYKDRECPIFGDDLRFEQRRLKIIK